jgi:uncharacterized cupredoxin-like copper-binding protein
MKITPTSVLRLLVVTFLAALLAACSSNQPGSVASGDKVARSSTINVVSEDLQFSLDSTQVSAGTVTFVVKNEGDMPHDFAMDVNGEEHKTAMIHPGETETLIVDLRPGTYSYKCTVPGHALLGMRGTITVN